MPGFEIFGDEERKEVQDVLNTGVLFRYGFEGARDGHWKAKSFERLLSERLNVGYCHLCSSGSAALSIALASCGIGTGDEVIVPPFTFVATIEAVLLAGAVPVFSEIDDTLCLDPDRLKEVISPRTKAVLCVHMCGSMAQIDAISGFCRENGLVLIEDACQALGATFNGKALGSFGDMGCFSFDPVKTITCGEGGAIVTDDERLYRIADGYSDHGHDHVGNDRGMEQHPIIGTNFRISELNAAVGLAQLKKLDHILSVQQRNKRLLKDALAEIFGLEFRRIPDEKGDSATFLTFFAPDEKSAARISRRLAAEGVDGCFHWFANNWHYHRQWEHIKRLAAPFRLPLRMLENIPDYEKISLPQSDGIMGRAISMLIKLSWKEEELDRRITSAVKAIQEGLQG